MRVGRLTAWAGSRARCSRQPAHPRRTRLTSGNRCTGTPPTAGAEVDADSLKAFTLDRVGAAEHGWPARRRAVAPRPSTTRALGARARRHAAALRGARDRRSWRRGWRPSTRRSRPTRARASTTRRPRSSPTRARWASTRPCGRARARATSTRTTRASDASTSATSRATANNDEARSFVESDPVGESKAAAVTAAAELGPEVQLRTYRLALTTDPSYATYFGGRQRHRGQGHADEPREPDLRGPSPRSGWS